MLRIALLLIVLMSVPALADSSAVLKATKGNGLIYARHYEYVRDKIRYVRCNTDKPDFVSRNEYIVMESEDLCTATNRKDQVAFIKLLMEKLKSDGSVIGYTAEVPRRGDTDQVAKMDIPTSKNGPELKITEGNKFKVKVFIKSSNEVSTGEAANKYFGNTYPNINADFVEPVLVPESGQKK